MKLYLTDLALKQARFALDVPSAFASPEIARAEAKDQAAELIIATGYHLRDAELGDIEAHVAAASAVRPSGTGIEGEISAAQ